MISKSKVLGYGILAILLSFGGGCSGGSDGGSQTAQGAGDQRNTPPPITEVETVLAADFELPRLEGGTFRLSDHRGEIVLLDFWATWCPPCRMAIPHLIKVYEQYKDKNVIVVGIALDEGGAAVIEKFADSFKIPYPILIGDADVVAKYGNFQGIPVSFLINQKGEIIERHSGFRPRQIYEAAIELLLAEKGDAAVQDQ
jgi:thiol-disulfide isomerase/thioredoxin